MKQIEDLVLTLATKKHGKKLMTFVKEYHFDLKQTKKCSPSFFDLHKFGFVNSQHKPKMQKSTQSVNSFLKSSVSKC